MIKFTGLLCRKPGMSRADFIQYHRYNHAPLFSSLPSVATHVRRYKQSHAAADDLPGFPASPFDGITEIWFDDMAGMKAVFEDPEYFEIIRPDEAKFIDFDRSQLLIMDEFPVIGTDASA